MAPISRGTFTRRLGRLAPAALAAFVADLWTARGYETDIDDRVVTATGADGTTCLLAYDPALPAGALDEIDVLVAPRGLSRAWRERAESAGVAVLDAADLHRIVLYAVDRSETTELLETHLGPPAPLAVVRKCIRGVGTRLPTDGTTTLLVVAVFLTAAVAVPTISSPEASVNAGETMTSSTEPPPSTSTARPFDASTCPVPPGAATAAALSPAVASSSGEFGLDGWRATPGYNTSDFHAPQNRFTGYDHLTRYVSTYESPSGRLYRVLIDRWRSSSTARRVAEERATDWWLWLVWGRYSFAISAYETDGGQLTGPLFEETTYALFATVSKPGGPLLGEACARTLAVRPREAGRD